MFMVYFCRKPFHKVMNALIGAKRLEMIIFSANMHD